MILIVRVCYLECSILIRFTRFKHRLSNFALNYTGRIISYLFAFESINSFNISFFSFVLFKSRFCLFHSITRDVFFIIYYRIIQIICSTVFAFCLGTVFAIFVDHESFKMAGYCIYQPY